jgi:nucleoside 2-deoxyribosyltransferase
VSKAKNRKKKQIVKKQGFFAYSNYPRHLSDTIVNAIKEANSRSSDLEITSWEWMPRWSSRIISNILEAIEKSDLYLADISGLNPNVLFEAGYAFGKRKHSLLFTQGFSTKERLEDLKDAEIIAGWDIGSYENSNQLRDLIERKNPFRCKASPEYEKYSLIETDSLPNRGLFLQGTTSHNIALNSLKTFKEIYSEVHVDDWNENSAQSLIWYVKEVNQASGIVALFLPQGWNGSRATNARFSFVCGMAVALGKKVKMVGLPGYDTPFDYKELMLLPDSGDQASFMIREAFKLDESLFTTEQTLRPEIIKTEASKKQLLTKDKEYILLEINLGDSIAENEEKALSTYFIQTGQFAQALKCRQAVVVGCKGTGKTATFYQLRNAFLGKHVRNIVCEIKPADYKMARFLSSLKKLCEQEGFVGHVLENVWKFILYCEIMIELKKSVDCKMKLNT